MCVRVHACACMSMRVGHLSLVLLSRHEDQDLAIALMPSMRPWRVRGLPARASFAEQCTLKRNMRMQQANTHEGCLFHVSCILAARQTRRSLGVKHENAKPSVTMSNGRRARGWNNVQPPQCFQWHGAKAALSLLSGPQPASTRANTRAARLPPAHQCAGTKWRGWTAPAMR